MALGQNMRNRLLSFPAQTTQSSGRLTVSRSSRQEERVHRSCTTNLHCITPVQILQITMCLEGFIERGESLIRTLCRTPEFYGATS
ncbi:hypothetical protein PoB_005079100 [Plakobranchus ocellatus]|uniref:Uncharacterized protein n=1 Tax=Plakobranchus ocellatus TaxID=259542 RepID=A0AAV4BYU6_9GAST|nr:hypothetical protein PoB_005079100 [Plakobranchus ocellatus]